MTQITLGALTTLNLSTHLDVMFSDLYGYSKNIFSDGVGNVGIGTLSPVYPLDVRGPVGIGMRLRNSTSGVELAIRTDAASAGIDAGNAANGLTLSVGSIVRVFVDSSSTKPGADNSYTFGSASARWSTVYAGSSTINTSDAREKTAVSSLTPAEIAASKQLASELGSFRFLSAVAAKDGAARLHIGMTVQRAMAVMQSHGLDPLRYAFICHDQWVSAGDTPAGDRYGFRTDELLLFIARGFDARLAALEAT
jgi:hypothetical protein